MLKWDYAVEDTGHSFQLTLWTSVIFEVYYEADKCTSPLSKERAEELAKTFKSLVETECPVESLNKEDYATPLDDLLDVLSSEDDCDCDDDSCGCGSDKMESFMKMMLLSKLMSD